MIRKLFELLQKETQDPQDYHKGSDDWRCPECDKSETDCDCGCKSVKEAEEDRLAAEQERPDIIQQDKAKEEAEEEASDITPDEQDEDESPEGSKEYLGNNGTDMYFYFVKTPNSQKGTKDLQVTDSSGKILFSAEEHGLPIDNAKDFLTQALREVDMANIAFEIVMKYMVPAEEKSEEEIEDDKGHPQTKQPDQGDLTGSKSASDGIGTHPMPVGVGSRVGESKINELMKKFELNEDYADNWKVGDYIDQLGKITGITPKAVRFINDEGQKSTLIREPMPGNIAKHFTPKQSKGKLHNVDMDKMYKTGDIDGAMESKLREKFGLKEDQYKSDDDIAAEFNGMNITNIEVNPSGNSGWVEIEFPEGEEHVGGGTTSVVDHWIKYKHNGKVALENWYPEETYFEIVRQIEDKLKGDVLPEVDEEGNEMYFEKLAEKYGLNEKEYKEWHLTAKLFGNSLLNDENIKIRVKRALMNLQRIDVGFEDVVVREIGME